MPLFIGTATPGPRGGLRADRQVKGAAFGEPARRWWVFQLLVDRIIIIEADGGATASWEAAQRSRRANSAAAQQVLARVTRQGVQLAPSQPWLPGNRHPTTGGACSAYMRARSEWLHTYGNSVRSLVRGVECCGCACQEAASVARVVNCVARRSARVVNRPRSKGSGVWAREGFRALLLLGGE